MKFMDRLRLIQNLVEDFETELENMDNEELKNLCEDKGYIFNKN